MNAAWLSDIHLDFLKSKHEERLEFYKTLVQYDAVIISGDIATNTAVYLIEMTDRIKKPIYFVLGNHDYYRSSFLAVQESMLKLKEYHPDIHYLSLGSECLNETTAIVGVDGWYDLKNGSFKDTKAILADCIYIKELKPSVHVSNRYFYNLDKTKLKNIIKDKVKQDKEILKNQLDTVLKNRNITDIIVVLHVPPFEQSSIHEGKSCSPEMLPYFSSKTYGRMLLSAAKKRPKVNFTVLCGHTHSATYYKPLDNLQVYTAGAEYGLPSISGIVHLSPRVTIETL